MQSKITKITTQKRSGRFNIFIDGHYAFPISENVLVKYQIVKDMEIDQSLEERLMAAEQVDKMYQKAINYLAGQLRTEQEVTTKLKSFTDDIDLTELVLQKLRDNLLLDDQNYANSYVRSEVRMCNKGPAVINQHLKQKGISDDKIQLALHEFYSVDDMNNNALLQAQKLFKRHHNESFNQTLNKIKTGLVRKGYSFDTINTVMNKADLKPDFDHQAIVLKKQFDKLWHRYQNLDVRERKYKIKQSLYRRGFGIDEINQLIDEQPL